MQTQNIKISKEFQDCLLTEECFKNEPKALLPSFNFMAKIADLNYKNNNQPVEFFSKAISDIYRYYTEGIYLPYISAMESLNILKINHSYCNFYPPELKHFNHCKTYQVTDWGCQLLTSCNMSYLKVLQNKSHRRRISQKVSKKINALKSKRNDSVLHYVSSLILNLDVNYEKLKIARKKAKWSDAQEAHVTYILTKILDKSNSITTYTEKEGRLHHLEVLLNSDARVLLSYKNKLYIASIDIRSCHPTFLSSYLLQIHKLKLNSINNNYLNTINNTLSGKPPFVDPSAMRVLVHGFRVSALACAGRGVAPTGARQRAANTAGARYSSAECGLASL